MSVALSHLLIPEKCYGTLHTVDSHSVENLVLLALMTRSVTFHKFFYNALLINSPAFIKQSIKSMSIGDGHVSGERPFRSAIGRESRTDKHSLTLASRFATRRRKKKSRTGSHFHLISSSSSELSCNAPPSSSMGSAGFPLPCPSHVEINTDQDSATACNFQQNTTSQILSSQTMYPSSCTRCVRKY